MITVDQTIMHDPNNGVHGNCFSAVLASLLHIPIEQVPVFSDELTWRNKLNLWLADYGLAYVELLQFKDYAESNGIVGCHHELAGTSVRSEDVLHACVAVDGKLRFDPHPSRVGINNEHASGVFISLRPWETKAAQLEAQKND